MTATDPTAEVDGGEVEALLYAHRTLANGPSDCVCACDRTWRPASEYRAHLATVLAALLDRERRAAAEAVVADIELAKRIARRAGSADQ